MFIQDIESYYDEGRLPIFGAVRSPFQVDAELSNKYDVSCK